MNAFHPPTGKNPRGAGRKPCNQNKAAAEQVIKETAPAAAVYLKEIANGERMPDKDRIDVCKYLINQAIGMPKQRQEVTGEEGGPLSLIVKYEKGNDDNTSEPGETPGAKAVR